MVGEMNRRNFLSQSIKVTAVSSLAGTLSQLSACSITATPRPHLNLHKDPLGICDLPAGFTYTILSTSGETMDDGHTVPSNPDGMGCFVGPDGGHILVRNHEIMAGIISNNPSPAPQYAYDSEADGGTTNIWLNRKLEVSKQYLSMTGTIRNCSGGVTPWGTWISSEEAASQWWPLSKAWMMGKRHGYNYEVNPNNPISRVEPLRAMGRFNHEAVGIDPVNGIAYQTEDNSSGCFYRFVPNRKGNLEGGGLLQALRFVEDNSRHTTKNPLQLNKKYACSWVTVDEPDPEKNTVHQQAQAKGAAIFVRGEGLAVHKDGIYFVCTSGGDEGLGQFFKYVSDEDGSNGTIELVYEAREKGVIENPDNIILNQWGDLIICEDSGQDINSVIGLTPMGKIYYIAANTLSEWSGTCLSADGQVLFANIQKNPGLTLAIQGPWNLLREA